jgi:hypothetical protein
MFGSDIIRKITSRSEEFTIKESPMRGQTISVLGFSVLVKISLVTVTPKNKKSKTVHLVEGLAVVKGKRFVRTDLTVEKLLRYLRKEIENYFKKSKA